MWKLAAAFAEVALRRRGPESLPDSIFLVVVLLVIDLGVSVLLMTVVSGQPSTDFLLLAADTVLYLAFIYALLTFFKLERRFRQTVTALLGADIWITSAYLMLALVALGFGAELGAPPVGWLELALYFWLVYISAWVLARSLSQTLIVGFMFEILYLYTWLSLRNVLVPPAVTLSSTST